MAVVKAEPKPAYLDLDNAVEVEDKLTRALDAVQAHGDRLKEKTEAGEQLTTEDVNHLESLIKKLKMIEKRQTTLHDYVDADVKKKEEGNIVAAAARLARRNEAMKITKEKAAKPVLMQELRDMNQIEMDSDDKEKRWKEANAPKRITPSGGLIGFKIADDLLTKEYKEENEGLTQIGSNYNK
ncbi:g3664 [Coccomyxa viridis]|uniref:G3664 protein n=1 Tax=Coccomyxa viridis TaxID=1274662 RepID=A0ABP1FNB9_9CHLO